MNAEDFLKTHVEQDSKRLFGVSDEKYINEVARAWMNDRGNSRHRFDNLEKALPGSKKILDMASGCGTCVFYGLMNGYDIYGIDPEKWKHEFNTLKAKEYGYPEKWLDRFYTGMVRASRSPIITLTS